LYGGNLSTLKKKWKKKKEICLVTKSAEKQDAVTMYHWRKEKEVGHKTEGKGTVRMVGLKLWEKKSD